MCSKRVSQNNLEGLLKPKLLGASRAGAPGTGISYRFPWGGDSMVSETSPKKLEFVKSKAKLYISWYINSFCQ